MNNHDRVRLLDMRDEAHKLRKALEGKQRTDLEDYLTANGVIHVIALIGEAAAQVTSETRDQYPSIPWKDMIGMRNFVIHHYHRVTLDVIWETVTRSIPDLLVQLDLLLDDETRHSE